MLVFHVVLELFVSFLLRSESLELGLLDLGLGVESQLRMGSLMLGEEGRRKRGFPLLSSSDRGVRPPRSVMSGFFLEEGNRLVLLTVVA